MSETKAIQTYKNPELVVLRNPVARAKFGLSLVQTKFLFEVFKRFFDAIRRFVDKMEIFLYCSLTVC